MRKKNVSLLFFQILHVPLRPSIVSIVCDAEESVTMSLSCICSGPQSTIHSTWTHHVLVRNALDEVKMNN